MNTCFNVVIFSQQAKQQKKHLRNLQKLNKKYSEIMVKKLAVLFKPRMRRFLKRNIYISPLTSLLLNEINGMRRKLKKRIRKSLNATLAASAPIYNIQILTLHESEAKERTKWSNIYNAHKIKFTAFTPVLRTYLT